MADEVVVTSGKTLRVGDNDWPIRDTGTRVEFVDLVLENRIADGIVYLSLGQAVVDGNGPPEALTAVRMRMTVVAAQHLRDSLDRLVKVALQPIDKSQAN